jgi:hypothetical protein
VSDDWNRYGAGRANDRGVAGAHRTAEDLADDPFFEYRYEGRGEHRDLSSRRAPNGPRKRPHPPARKLIGALLAVLIVVGTASFLNRQLWGGTEVSPASATETGPQTTPTATSAPTETATAPIVQMAHPNAAIQLPIPVLSPDRTLPVDDGENIYLIGATGALAISSRTGHVTVFGGSDFPKDLRKSLYADGLWVSTWPATLSYCGPSCWDLASTYRIDPATGAVSLKLPGAYLVGVANGDVLVASRGQLESLDPLGGSVDATYPWHSLGEPRVGCGSFWSFTRDSKHSSLGLVTQNTGLIAGTTEVDAAVTFGPIALEGQCWLMTGSGGASPGSTALEWLLPDGGIFKQIVFGTSVVLLDGEYWTYAPDGVMQRLEPSSGVGYGRLHQLPRGASGEPNPLSLFAAGGSLWMVDGTVLTGFDLPTGSSAVNR